MPDKIIDLFGDKTPYTRSFLYEVLQAAINVTKDVYVQAQIEAHLDELKGSGKRDYAYFGTHLLTEAQKRKYAIFANPDKPVDSHSLCSDLWLGTEANIYLYIDVFAAAFAACTPSEENIYR